MRASAARHALLDAGGGVLDPVAQLDEALLEPGGVLDQVELPGLAEHGLLGGAQPAHAEREHDREDQRDAGDAGGGEGDDPFGRVEHAGA